MFDLNHFFPSSVDGNTLTITCHHPLGLTFHLQKDTLENFKCGGDFLPSPLASKPRFALKALPALTRPGLLTAVAVAVENDHTIAFLGSSQGEILKVGCFVLFFPPSSLLDFYPFLVFSCGETRRRNCGRVLKLSALCVQVHLTTDAYVYSETPAETIGDAVNRNLFFDQSQSHIYVTTEKKVFVSSHCSFFNNRSVLQCV